VAISRPFNRAILAPAVLAACLAAASRGADDAQAVDFPAYLLTSSSAVPRSNGPENRYKLDIRVVVQQLFHTSVTSDCLAAYPVRTAGRPG